MAAAIATAITPTAVPPFQASALAAGNRIRFTNDKVVHIPADVSGLHLTLQGRFDAGPTLRVTQPGNRFRDGQTIRIRDDQGVTVSFELDSDGIRVDPLANAVSFTAASTATELAETIADAINSAGFNVEATVVGDQISLTNDRQVLLSDGLTGIAKISQGLTISSTIDPLPFLLDYPGGDDDPGHRDIPEEVGSGVEQHINNDFQDQGRDSTPGVTTILYNFRDDYGSDAQGIPSVQRDHGPAA